MLIKEFALQGQVATSVQILLSWKLLFLILLIIKILPNAPEQSAGI